MKQLYSFVLIVLCCSTTSLFANTLTSYFSMNESSWGAIIDSSDRGLIATPKNGAYPTDTSPALTGTTGTCGYAVFDGVDDVIEIPHDSELNSNSFSVSLWARVDGGSGRYRSPLTSRGENGGDDTYGYNIYVSPANYWQFWTSKGAAGYGWNIIQGSAATNEWTHIVATFERTGTHSGTTLIGTKKIYINGELINTQSNQYYRPMTGSVLNPLTIGSGGGKGTNYYFNGAIDEVSTYSTVLNQTDVSRIHQARHSCDNGSVSPDILTSYFKLDETTWGDVIDSSGNGFDGAALNGAFPESTSSARVGASGTCGYGSFDGTNDRVLAPSSDLFNSESFSVSFWAKPARASSYQPAVSYVSYNKGQFGYGVYVDPYHYWVFYTQGGYVKGPYVSSSWTHVVATFERTSGSGAVVYGTKKLYINGVLASSALNQYYNRWNNSLVIGGGSSDNYYFNYKGSVDEVKTYSNALSASSVTALFEETHLCNGRFQPLSYFELDEFNVADVSGELVDNMGLSTSAQTLGSALGVSPSSEGNVCYGIDIHENTDSTVYAIDTGVDVNTDIGNKGSVTFWYRSVDEWNGGNNRVLFDASTEVGKFFYLVLKSDGKLRFGAEDANDNDMILESPTFNFPANTWTHISLSWDTESRSYLAYVNGVATTLSYVAQTQYYQTATIADLNTLHFGDTASGYHYGGTDHSGYGRFDEIRIYNAVIDASQVAFDRDADHQCDEPPLIGSAAASFNCVYGGLDALSGRLYTQQINTGFNLNVIALKDSNSDSAADGVEETFAADADRAVTVELVDTSSSLSCSSSPALNPTISKTLTFTAEDLGQKTENFTVAKAYRSVACRVTDNNDASSVIGCSTDSFSIRPSSLTLNTPALSNGSSSGTPTAKAGSDFSLSVSSVVGYDGVPQLASSSIEAHSTAIQTGTLSGSFNAADSSTGIATATDFNYSEVGSFRFLTEAIKDTSFTSIDQPNDCIDDSYSNTADANGKIGCDFSNSTASPWIGRFTPDHFLVTVTDDGSLENTCAAGNFSYVGDAIAFEINPLVSIVAKNADDLTTQNYTGDHLKLLVSDITIPTVNADTTTLGVDAATALSLSMTGGSRSLVDNLNGSMTLTLSANEFTYSHDSNAQVPAFVSDIDLLMTGLTDSDSISATALPLTISPDGASMRYGRLNIANAHGSELQTLPLSMQVQYYLDDNSGFVANTQDSCTSITNFSFSDGDETDSLSISDTCIWDSAGSSNLACVDTGEFSEQYQSTPINAAFNVNLEAPNESGVLSVEADAPVWLEYDWQGAGEDDPKARVTFGINNRDTNVIFQRQVR